MRVNEPRLLLGTALLVVILGGCGSGSTGAIDDTRDPSQGAQQLAVLPLTSAVNGNANDNRVLSAAKDQLTQECMHRAGFSDYRVVRSASHQDDMRFYDKVFNLESEEDIEVILNFTPVPIDQGPQLSPEGTVALLGPDSEARRLQITTAAGRPVSLPREGCIAEVDRTLEGGDDGRIDRIMRLDAVLAAKEGAYDALGEASDFQRLNSEFSTCMKDKGIEVDSPRNLQVADHGTAAQTYRTMLECKRSVNYDVRGYELLAREEQAIIDKNPGLVTDWVETRTAMLDKARRILAEK